MKTIVALLMSTILGIAIGASLAYVKTSQPGPEFDRLMGVSSRPVIEPTVSEGAVPARGVVVEGGEKFDFGVMDRGETRQHTFKFLNDSDKPLTLKIGSTTCKCTVGELEADTVAPGAVGNVILEWIAKSFDDHFQQMANIETSDQQRPNIMLTVSGQVLQLVQPIPQSVFLNDTPFGVERDRQLLIYSFQEGDELTVIDHEFDDETTAEFYEFTWKPADLVEFENAPDGARSAVVCNLKVLPGLPYGNVAQSLRITTDAERSAVVELPIGGRVVSDLMIAGAGIFEEAGVLKLGMVPPEGKKVRLRIVARRADVHKAEIVSIVCEPENVLKAKVGEVKSVKNGAVLMYPLTVEVPAEAPACSFMGARERSKATIVIQTTHPVVKKMELDVRFFKMK